MARFAGVCLLNKPFCADGVYDYRIPEEFDASVAPGVFVTVPFGVANTPSQALVVETRATSAYPEVKSISSVIPEAVSLDEEMLGLCAFMKQRMLCTTGDAVRAMIPAGALSRLAELYAVSADHIPNDSDELSSSDSFVYAYLSERGELPLSAIRSHFGAGVELSLRRLCARGYASRRLVWQEGSAEKTERVYSLAVSLVDARALAEGETVGNLRLTSQKHRAVLRALLDEGAPMVSADLYERADVTSVQLKNLLEKGLLLAHDRRVERDPYAATEKKPREILLNDEQSAAVETLSSLAFSGEAKAALLHGVTGSGKTCVMQILIDRLLEKGKGVIVLLPEISLTPQSVSIFCSRYGDRVAVIHSALSAGERYDAYRKIREGRADVVIGTRSAVFAPVRNLGAIIIDEEQEHTYKSDQDPKYHARDIARYRCGYHRALMLLASATPSVESYRKAKEGIYSLVRLTGRYGGAKLPRVEIADMREEMHEGNLSPLGDRLLRNLGATLEKKEQAILFLNRRGYNHYVSCRSCGEAVTCPNCSVAMTYHTARRSYADGELVCHWCGKRMPLPKVCPNCSSEHLTRMGFGTQRVEEELSNLFPEATVLRMDADTTTTKFAYDELLGAFREHRADILLGTQMVTKGHDFPAVTLAGVLLADASLYLDDYRAGERTFAMLTQVIGRAGRGELAGSAVIQTNNPANEIIRLACAQDYETFYEREIRLRKQTVFPPFCDIALLTMTGSSETELLKATARLSETLTELATGEYKDVELLSFGPFEAPVYRVDNRYRMRMVLKCRLTRRTLALLAELLTVIGKNCGKKLTLSVDLNPTNL